MQKDTVIKDTVFVRLPDGSNAPLLVPNLNADQKLAVISQNVLKSLSKLLPKAGMGEIKLEHIRNVEDSNSMKDYITVLQTELEFHMSVNMINEFFYPLEAY